MNPASESRPERRLEAARDRWAASAHDSTPRCRECGHVVWSRESIETGLGQDCRRRLRAMCREVAA